MACWFIAVGLLGPSSAQPVVAPRPALPGYADTVERALPLLQRTAAGYSGKRSCFSCHHQALPAMAVDVAARRGFAVDRQAAAAQTRFTHRYFFARRKRVGKGESVPGGPFTAGYALVGLHADGFPADEVTAALTAYLLKKQRASGQWRITTNRPPLESSHFTATALAARGLLLYSHGLDADKLANRIARARRWLLNAEPQTTEDAAFRLLGLVWTDAGGDDVAEAAEQLLRQQLANGAWSQTKDMPGDAYATGQVLVALQTAGTASADRRIERGLKFLVAAQRADGSWFVQTRSRPIQTYFESGYPHGKSQFISTAAASWAVTALANGTGRPLHAPRPGSMESLRKP